jgi:hypothetical protein
VRNAAPYNIHSHTLLPLDPMPTEKSTLERIDDEEEDDEENDHDDYHQQDDDDDDSNKEPGIFA